MYTEKFVRHHGDYMAAQVSDLGVAVCERLEPTAVVIDESTVPTFNNRTFSLRDSTEELACDCGAAGANERLDDEARHKNNCPVFMNPEGSDPCCACGVWGTIDYYPHEEECAEHAANFHFKGNEDVQPLKVRWYKRPGRGMELNRAVTREELRTIFAVCHESLR